MSFCQWRQTLKLLHILPLSASFLQWKILTVHFFLHHGESPGAILFAQPLTEDNYPTWARAMRMALDAKSKLGFVDGSITASMAVTSLEKQA